MSVDNSGNTIDMGGVSIVINPGSGPVRDATEENASANIAHLITDLGIDGEVRALRLPEQDDRGRFAYLLYWGNRCVEVEMPGLPLSQVRFMNEPGQDIWEFPRLSVDGNSWVWFFAVNCVRRALDWEESE